MEQYLEIVREILDNGVRKNNRTGHQGGAPKD